MNTCPKCGSEHIEETTIGYFCDNPNDAKCVDCGWKGKVKELKSLLLLGLNPQYLMNIKVQNAQYRP